MTNETLEEAFSQYVNEKYHSPTQGSIPDLESARFGAKWQAEKIHNDVKVFTEELKDKIDSFEYSVNQNSYISDYVKEWFEQFKNK